MKHTNKILLTSALVLSTVALASCNNEIKQYVNNETPITYEKGDQIVTFGQMPKTKVSAEEVASLGLTSTEGKEKENEIVTKKGTDYYKVASAKVNATGMYKASTGETLNAGETYWFKMENIEWRVLDDDGSSYTLISENVISASAVYYALAKTFTDNRTGYFNEGSNKSYIRLNRYLTNTNEYGWLTQMGLDAKEDEDGNPIYEDGDYKYIKSSALKTIDYTQTVVDGDAAYETTKAKVITLSEEELDSYDSLSGQSKRIAVTTDYARCQGAWMSINSATYGYGTYWLRDTTTIDSNTYSGMFKIVNEQGKVTTDYGFNTFGGVRPVIKVAKNKTKTA